jgi:hypothetical protein
MVQSGSIRSQTRVVAETWMDPGRTGVAVEVAFEVSRAPENARALGQCDAIAKARAESVDEAADVVLIIDNDVENGIYFDIVESFYAVEAADRLPGHRVEIVGHV